MLDLTDVNRWQIKLPNEKVLTIKMPTIRRLKEVQETLLFVSGDIEIHEREKALYDMLLLIFNDNTNGMRFIVEDLENILQPKHLYMVLEDYMKYCNILKKK